MWFACSGNRKRSLVWLRKHQRKHGETCVKLRASLLNVDKDKDADENVDADQVRTVRPVCSHNVKK